MDKTDVTPHKPIEVTIESEEPLDMGKKATLVENERVKPLSVWQRPKEIHSTSLPVDHGIPADEIYDDSSALDRWRKAVTPPEKSPREKYHDYNEKNFDLVSGIVCVSALVAFSIFICVVSYFQNGKCP